MGTDRCVFVYLHGHVKLSQTSQCFIHIFWSIQSESEVTQSCLTLCDPWTVAHQAPSSMGFSRQEYWSGLPFPSPGDLPDPGIEPRSPTLQADALTSAPPGKPLNIRIQSLELQIQVRDFKGGKEARLKEEGGGGGRRGGERGGLTDVSCHLQIPRCYGTFPWASREGRLELGPTRNQNQNSSSLPRGGDQSPILSSG